MNLQEYRESPAELARTGDIQRLMPERGATALDIGARDGHFSRLLASRFEIVTALDLVRPEFTYERVTCVEGNVTRLEFPDHAFDFVLCSEVLEHIPTQQLQQACNEISRVCRGAALIGVPYKQDTRVGQTTCQACGKVNPPWGHVNTFDEKYLERLFPTLRVQEVSFVGTNKEMTNALSAFLMNRAGNPFGTYDQDEPCVYCGATLTAPAARNAAQKVLSKAAHYLRKASESRADSRPNWIHVKFSRS